MLRRFPRAFAVAAACGLIASVAYAAIPGSSRLSLIPSPSGIASTKYADGNDGASAIPLLWATVDPISVATGATGSRNDRIDFLTELGSPSATLTLSCNPTLAGNFTAGVDGISWAATTAYSGLCQWSATRLTVTIFSSVFRVEAVAAASSDTTAPTIPTGCVISNGTSNFTVTCDASSDPFTSEAGSGVNTYDVCLNGAGCQSVTAQAGLSKQLTFTNIGTLSPTPTAIQTGADWALVSAGTGDGTADAHGFAGASLSGDFVATAKCNAITVSANYGKCGVEVRDSTAANSKKFECEAAKLLAGTTFYGSRHRLTDGATTSSLATVNPVAVPMWLRLTGAGATYTCDYSTDGNAWTNAGTDSAIGFATTRVVGLWDTATTGGGGATATIDLQQFSLNNVARWSYTYNTSSSGTVTVRANDVSGNHSAFNSVGTATPTVPTDTTAPTFSVQPSGSANGSQTTINWSCGTATDANGIRGYIPSVCGTTSSCAGSADQAEQVNASFTQSSLTANTAYYLRCKAVDPSGNVSSYTTIATATTASSAPPAFTAPTISSVAQPSDRSASFVVTHSAVSGADHYKLQEADCVDGLNPSTYSVLASFNHSNLAVTRTGLAISDAKSYKVAAANLGESVIGPYSTATACTFIFEPWSSGIRWHPGHYIASTTVSDANTSMTRGAPWVGVELQISTALGVWERDSSPGNPVTGSGYEEGKAIMDSLMASAAANSKQVWIALEDKVYTNGVGNGAAKFPGYMASASGMAGGWMNCTNATSGCGGVSTIMRTDLPAVADRWIAFGQWICNFYGNDSHFEGLQWAGFSVPYTLPDYSVFDPAAYATQVERVMAAWRQACPKLQIGWRLDWVTGGVAKAEQLYKFARGYRMSGTDYDTFDFKDRTGSVSPGTPNTTYLGDYGAMAFRGSQVVSGAGVPGTAGVGGVDLRGKSTYLQAVSCNSMILTKFGMASINEIFDIAKFNKAGQLIWNHCAGTNSGTAFSPASTELWSAVVLACLESGTGTGCTPATRDAAVTATRPSDWP